VFDSDRPGHCEIFTVGRDGSGVRHLTFTLAKVSNLYPSFSPDGTSIVFYSNRTGHFQLFKTIARGGQVRQLTRGSAATSNTDPEWQPLPSGR
jgi:hypothetical protein